MNRPIKFRVWDKKYGMREIGVYNVLRSSDNGVWEFGYEGSGRDIEKMSKIDGESMVLMQFTGLVDKNGKDIYEGDIVEHHIFGKQLVIWKGQSFWLEDVNRVKYLTLGFFDEWHKVIGNIYENSELISDGLE